MCDRWSRLFCKLSFGAVCDIVISGLHHAKGLSRVQSVATARSARSLSDLVRTVAQRMINEAQGTAHWRWVTGFSFPIEAFWCVNLSLFFFVFLKLYFKFEVRCLLWSSIFIMEFLHWNTWFSVLKVTNHSVQKLKDAQRSHSVQKLKYDTSIRE